jgi:hypothetical protein
MRDWVTNLSTTHYLVGSVIGPHPFPTLVRDFQKVIGKEIKSQLREIKGKLPDVLVACVGGGSNAIGTFYDFIPDENVRLVGVEAGGEGSIRHMLEVQLFNTHTACFRDRWSAPQRHAVDGPTRCPSRSQDIHSPVNGRPNHRDAFDQRGTRLSWSWP